MYGALSLLPPLFAIGLAIWTKQVYLALMTGILYPALAVALN